VIWFRLREQFPPSLLLQALAPRGKLVLGMGLGALLLVPAFKSITGGQLWSHWQAGPHIKGSV
jgi:hypothetical protein